MKEAIKAVEVEIKTLKKLYRDRNAQPPHWKTYQGLARLKLVSTVMYATIAASRGRIHAAKWDLASQAKFIADNAKLLPVREAEKVSAVA